MTKPLPPDTLRRRRRHNGQLFRFMLACPVCQQADGFALELIQWRRYSARFECPCGLRFTLNLAQLDASVRSQLERVRGRAA